MFNVPNPGYFGSGADFHFDLYHQDHPSFHPSPFASSSGPPQQHPQKRHRGLLMSNRGKAKQRKQRKDANARERTVTTLTENPHTPYLVPTPSEEPAGSMSYGTGSAGGGAGMGQNMHGMPMGQPAGYQMQNSNYGYGFPAPFSPMQSMQPPQQQQYFPPTPSQQQRAPPQSQKALVHPDVRPKVPLPPGQNDLAILQNLKKLILDNQHPFYKAIPNPEALAKYYKGKALTTQPQSWNRKPDDTTSAPPPKRHQRGQGGKKQGAANQGNRNNKSTVPPNVASLDISGLKIGQGSSGPPSAGPIPPQNLGSSAGTTGNDPKDSDVSMGGPVASAAVQAEVPAAIRPPTGSDDRDNFSTTRQTPAIPPTSAGSEEEHPQGNTLAERLNDRAHDDLSRPSEADSAFQSSAADLPSMGASDAPVQMDDIPLDDTQHELDSSIVPPPDVQTNDHLVPEVVIKQESRASSVVPPDRSVPSGFPQQSAPMDDLVSDISSARPSLKDRINPPYTEQRQGRSKRPFPKFQKGPNSGYNGPPHHDPPARVGDRYDRSPPAGPGGPPGLTFRGPSPARTGSPYVHGGAPPAGYRRSPPRDAAYSGGPPGPPPPSRGYNPRSPSLDTRPPSKLSPPGMPPPPGPRGDPRDYRGPPTRDMPRGRPDAYRPEPWADSYPEARYDERERRYRDYSPGRGPPSSSGGRDTMGPDGPPGRGDYPPYPPRSEWDDDYYKSRPWDGPPPPPSRSADGYDYPPRPVGYNPRLDRDFLRDGYPGRPPPPPSMDDRYPPGPPPRDADRRPPPPPGGYNTAPYSGRVRPRSPSPRRPLPNDDPRPPMKRPRDDDYYPPPPPPPSGGRPGGPPPGSGGPGGWGPPHPHSNHPSGPPPPSSSSGPGGGGGPQGDYRMGGPGPGPGGPRDAMGYGPPPPSAPSGSGGYDRPPPPPMSMQSRSPGPPPRGGGYPARGGYGDRGGYGPPRRP
ncbi:hypothetical protein D9613_000099 [Agrocybe pediades]|uniref:Uncharacterized protein n=1 Tax=Agrocybe pediades TaxID=84607 RepID=A0A8H4VUW1_9AGAR|nr:hypothetical protein D9613_000099 [Agrocybe pediades]